MLYTPRAVVLRAVVVVLVLIVVLLPLLLYLHKKYFGCSKIR